MAGKEFQNYNHILIAFKIKIILPTYLSKITKLIKKRPGVCISGIAFYIQMKFAFTLYGTAIYFERNQKSF